MGLFLCGVETVKSFVNIRLHCDVSNLKKISKMLTFHPWQISADAHGYFHPLTSFDVWASQAKLTMYEIED